MTEQNFQRGSEWRKWDLHIHTPASFHWMGDRFDPDPKSPANTALVDQMIDALNKSEPAVFAIMDYWTFDGWFALKHRLSQPSSPELKKTVFPGIELRLVAPMEGRLNAHVLFSDKVEDQVLHDFKSSLKIARLNRPLSNDALKAIARQVGEDLLKSKGYNKGDVDKNDDLALEAGSKIAEITCDSYRSAIKNVPNDLALGFMPFNTNDGLADVKWEEHYAYVLELFDSSPIFETRKTDTWAAFVGLETENNKKWLSNFQKALRNMPRLAVSGSDAHCFSGTPGDNDKRGYGDFPSDKITWIKANPTFEGLKQAIKEPAKRSFLGKEPEKVKVIENNKSFFLDRLRVRKASESTCPDIWLENTDIILNYDLIAIIGNKGSGKSALADITALLGNSKQSRHFSFLKENRFRGKTGDPAKHFEANLLWRDGKELENNLNDNPAIENVELVKYIPQGHFEELCNAHVSGRSDSFENELRTVIFSHASESIRLGSLDFDQLIENQESVLRNRLDELRGELHKLNRRISVTESQMSKEVRKSLIEKIAQQRRIVDEHDKVKPIDIEKPTELLTEEQRTASEKLSVIAEKIDANKAREKEITQEQVKLSAKKKASKNIKEQVELIKRSTEKLVSDIEPDFETLSLDKDKIVKLQIDEKAIEETELAIKENEEKLLVEFEKSNQSYLDLIKSQKELESILNGPQKKYQKYLDDLKSWEDKRLSLQGSKESPETLLGLEERLSQLDLLPEARETYAQKRIDLLGSIYDVLDEQRSNREMLFQPVQELIHGNSLIREEYKLQFKAELDTKFGLIADQLFSIVKQNSGEFRGEEESTTVIKTLVDKYNLNDKESFIGFVNELSRKLEDANSSEVGVNSLLRKGHTAEEVYNFIYGLEYVKPRYTLMFQGAEIGQLSPGQRGALLLIFYLLVDKGNAPIILDQPEENLDNETIVSLLVPVLNEAKEKRQVIMVTHNPNLAVVCDAEQIIHCEFDRKNGNSIKYTSGAIESAVINKKVVDVLEGTMPAFDNRKMKYH